jgi:NAD-dependent SIR2 family protein deacetylase
LPTFSHFALSELIKKGYLKHIISTNIDGLHIRSGTSPDDISEIHGNKYKEYCDECGKIYIRKFDTTNDVVKKSTHKTGRTCEECSNDLKDSIIHFGEKLWDEEIREAIGNSKSADLALVLGTSKFKLIHGRYESKTIM